MHTVQFNLRNDGQNYLVCN